MKSCFYKRLNQFSKNRGFLSWVKLVDWWFDEGWKKDTSGKIIGKAYDYGWNKC